MLSVEQCLVVIYFYGFYVEVCGIYSEVQQIPSKANEAETIMPEYKQNA